VPHRHRRPVLLHRPDEGRPAQARREHLQLRGRAGDQRVPRRLRKCRGGRPVGVHRGRDQGRGGAQGRPRDRPGRTDPLPRRPPAVLHGPALLGIRRRAAEDADPEGAQTPAAGARCRARRLGSRSGRHRPAEEQPVTSKLLVANRGEIAVRIMATAAALGVPTVAGHPGDDAACAHRVRADEAVQLPGTGAAAYLDVAQIVAAAVRTGCDALHPGYGFLAENPALARACAEHGITFVGPSPEALELYGDKVAARRRAQELGIPVLAATDGPTTPDRAHEFLDGLGPGGAVMVKALAGGGGRGMRPVTRREDLADALQRCASEARAAFGDDSVYVEQFLPRARHVEVRLAGDGETTVVVGDRACRTQGRRQKLVEIAPAPALPDTVRKRLHDAATKLVTDYTGLATVEFLVAGDEIAFLEVNPRIQVEHTVTEETTGLDLVELGLRIASGARLADLGLERTPIPRGAAVQVRVNTETIADDGTVHPGGGTLTRFQPPAGRGIRVDTHGYAGYQVSPRYDSLLAKVITTGADTAGAAALAYRALAEFDVAGPPTNIALLQGVLARPELADGTLHTTFVDDHIADLAATPRHASLPVAPESA